MINKTEDETMKQKFDRFTAEYKMFNGEQEVVVYGWGTYPRYSVLAGQPRKVFLDHFPTMAAAEEAYPGVKPSHPLIEDRNTFDHLPGDDL